MIVGIVGIPGELRPLRRRVDGIVVQERGPIAHVTRARWAGHDVILVACGVGKVNAALATMALIQTFRPDVIWNCGSAGALASELRIGDVVIGQRLAMHDAGVHLEDRFQVAGLPMPPERGQRMRYLAADSRWVARAREAANALGWDGERSFPRAVVGVIATGDQVIFSHAHKDRIRQTTGAIAVEQEGAAVAYTAHLHGIPWLVMRGISDTADGRAAFDYTRWVTYVDDPPRWGAIGDRWFRWSRQITSPRALMRTRRFRRGARMAMEHVTQLADQILRV